MQRGGMGWVQQHAAGDCRYQLRKEEIQNANNVEARAPPCTGDSLERGDTLQRICEVFEECERRLVGVLASPRAAGVTAGAPAASNGATRVGGGSAATQVADLAAVVRDLTERLRRFECDAEQRRASVSLDAGGACDQDRSECVGDGVPTRGDGAAGRKPGTSDLRAQAEVWTGRRLEDARQRGQPQQQQRARWPRQQTPARRSPPPWFSPASVRRPAVSGTWYPAQRLSDEEALRIRRELEVEVAALRAEKAERGRADGPAPAACAKRMAKRPLQAKEQRCGVFRFSGDGTARIAPRTRAWYELPFGAGGPKLLRIGGHQRVAEVSASEQESETSGVPPRRERASASTRRRKRRRRARAEVPVELPPVSVEPLETTPAVARGVGGLGSSAWGDEDEREAEAAEAAEAAEVAAEADEAAASEAAVAEAAEAEAAEAAAEAAEAAAEAAAAEAAEAEAAEAEAAEAEAAQADELFGRGWRAR